MSGPKPPPESHTNDLGALTGTLNEVFRSRRNITEFFVNQNDNIELSDPTAKSKFLKETHEAINACGGAAVSSLGGWNGEVPSITFESEEDEQESLSPFGQVALAASEQMWRNSYNMHAAYTSPVHRELTTQMIKNASLVGTKWDVDEEMSNVMILNSGSEACDAMIKLVWQYWNGKMKPGESKKPEAARKRLISRESSYHGNTIAALSLSHFPARQANFDGLLLSDDIFPKVDRYYPYRDMTSSEREVEQYDDRLVNQFVDKIEKLGHKTVAAFVIETVSGAALGCQPASLRYLRKIKKVCRHYKILLVYDEIMCGLGRTGYANAWHWYDKKFRDEGDQDDYIRPSGVEMKLEGLQNLAPDIMLFGKTLAAGLMPGAGLMVNKKVVTEISGKGRSLREFSHGHTYQAHPGVCAAALKAQKLLPDLLNNIHDRSRQLEDGLKPLKDRNYIGDIRGRGLFWGVEFVTDKGDKSPFGADKSLSSEFAKHCRVPCREDPKQKGLDVYAGAWTKTKDAKNESTNGDHIIISPAYDSAKEDIEKIIDLFTKRLGDFNWLKHQ
ncbi:hypothetical protein PG994_001206 [Apiospora phragmitis]|uniref:PLP-dependent transferase n=1 Tax=Apiospora phragmitis TaxID=2905665 RepID=A0ABR1WSV9_9PEZI